MLPHDITCCGPCRHCGIDHFLRAGPALEHCRKLMATLEAQGCIDWPLPERERDPRLSTEPLFGEARGQMFGVMVYRTPGGGTGVARAFSGQFNGVWHVDGWAPPLLDVGEFERETFHMEREIKRLGRMIARLDPRDALRAALNRERRDISRELMREIHAMYRLPSFRGDVVSLSEAFVGAGIPTGTADCCAPKLIAQAARNGWTPLGLAEFFWGRENRSGSKQHGRFYAACEEKCRPILGHLLCGLDNTP